VVVIPIPRQLDPLKKAVGEVQNTCSVGLQPINIKLGIQHIDYVVSGVNPERGRGIATRREACEAEIDHGGIGERPIKADDSSHNVDTVVPNPQAVDTLLRTGWAHPESGGIDPAVERGGL